jgi:hypothetical protein
LQDAEALLAHRQLELGRRLLQRTMVSIGFSDGVTMDATLPTR